MMYSRVAFSKSVILGVDKLSFKAQAMESLIIVSTSSQ